jgi:hypothetical protein
MVTDRNSVGSNFDYFTPPKEETPKVSSKTNPSYYKRWKLEPIVFCMENDLPFWLGSVIKYVMRYDQKNGLEDLHKAKAYIDFKIAELEGKNAK